MKRNVTVSLDEETARWIRVQAAQKDISVSRFLAELVKEERRAAEEYAAATDRFLSRSVRSISSGRRYPVREEIYDRGHLR